MTRENSAVWYTCQTEAPMNQLFCRLILTLYTCHLERWESSAGYGFHFLSRRGKQMQVFLFCVSLLTEER